MAEASDDLERMSREQLILKARVLGVERAELMTRVELRDEIVRRSEPDLVQQRRARGFLGVARDLVASVVEAGLNLPDAAAIIRGEGSREGDWKGPPPVATVTLAEIYAAQGHLDRALRMLDEVLAKEPDHDPARALRDRLAAGTHVPVAPPRRRQRISFADPDPIADPGVEQPAAPEPVVEAPAPEPVVEAPAPEPLVAAAEPTPEPAVEAPAPAEPTPEPVLEVPAPEPLVAAAEPTPEPAVEAPAPEPLVAAEPAPEAVTSEPAIEPCVLTLAVSGQRHVYWEVPKRTWDAVRSRAPGGRAVLRVVSFRTRAGKVERKAHDFRPDAEVGSATLPGLRADAVVRAALGWEVEGRFQAFVIASDLPLGSAQSERRGAYRPHPLVGPVRHGVEQRALAHLSRR